MTAGKIVIRPVTGKAGRAEFVDLGRMFAAREPHAVPQLRSEQLELVDPERNPFFGHARAQLYIAERDGKPVGRISAHIDELALQLPRAQGMGPGTGFFGYFDAEDEATAHTLLAQAEAWNRAEGMTRLLGPISMSIWEEPGLLVRGQDHSPTMLMGHHPAAYRGWIESADYAHVKSLYCYELDITHGPPPLIRRVVKSGENNPRITIRPVDKNRWEQDLAIVLRILNDAWSDNWGFVPFTDAEIAYAGKKLRPIVHERLNMIAEVDGEAVAFMVTFPDMNGVLKRIGGRLFPFGWVRLLRWLRKPMGADMRVPLMGVRRELHNTRIASQLAFMMIERIRESATGYYHSQRSEIGWILEDNQGMIAIADAIESHINREYVIFGRDLPGA